MFIWLNGEFVERDEAKVSIFDAGLQHAVGLFETLLARHGRVFRAEAHVQRLVESARELLLTERLRVRPLVEAVNLAVQRNNLSEARVRVTVTGGDLNYLQSRGAGRVDPTIIIVAQPPTTYPEPFFSDGVTAVITDDRANPLDSHAGHKTLNYWPRIRALQHAAARGAGEALWFTVSNHLASGSVSNIFLVRDEALLTPAARGEEEHGALTAPVLPGITRAAIIELAEARHLDVTLAMLTIEDLLRADEVFLTNSSWGVLPVASIEREQVADGRVGPITQQLRAAWLSLVDAETSRTNQASED